MSDLLELCRSGRLGPLVPGTTVADAERHLGAPDDVDFIHGEPSRQRHRYGSVRLTFVGRPGDEWDKAKLHLTAIQVRLSAPLRLPPSIEDDAGGWTSPSRDDVAGRLKAAGVRFDVEREFTDVTENQDLVVRLATGGNVLIKVFHGMVRSIDAFGP